MHETGAKLLQVHGSFPEFLFPVSPVFELRLRGLRDEERHADTFNIHTVVIFLNCLVLLIFS